MRTTANDRGRGALLLPRACAGTHRLMETATGLAERGQRWAEAQEQATYVSGNLAVLLALMWLTCACILQIRYVQGAPSWAGWALDAASLVLLTAYFVWAPRLLLHRRVGVRDLLPGAVITLAGLATLHVAASFVLRRWLVSYSSTYGGLGIVMAILFWLIAAATVMMFAAALSPAVAARRAAVRAGAAASANGLPGGAG